MGIANGSFETGALGEATSWTRSSVGSLLTYAEFATVESAAGAESFERDDFVSAYVGLFSDLDPATFEAGPTQEPHEDFEEDWGLVLPVFSGELAVFEPDDGDESFEWSSVVQSLTWYGATEDDMEWETLLPVIGLPTYALFGGAPYENFEIIVGWPVLTL